MRKYQKPNPLFNFSNIFSKTRTTSLTQSEYTPHLQKTFKVSKFISHPHNNQVSPQKQKSIRVRQSYSMHSSFVQETSRSNVFLEEESKNSTLVRKSQTVWRKERKVVTPQPMVRIDLYGLEKERRKEKMRIFVEKKSFQMDKREEWREEEKRRFSCLYIRGEKLV